MTPGGANQPAFSIIDSCTAACAAAGTNDCPDFGAMTCFDQCVDLQSNTDCHDTAHELVMCWTGDVDLCGAPATGDCQEAKATHTTCVTGVAPDMSSTTSSSSSSSSSSGGGSTTCSHSECIEGEALISTCSSCAAEVCAQDSYCCESAWDSVCTGIALETLSCGC